MLNILLYLTHMSLSINCKDVGDKVCKYVIIPSMAELKKNYLQMRKKSDIQKRFGKKKFLAIYNILKS